MQRKAKDWHPEDVKAAVRKSGTSLTALAVAAGLSESAVRRALITPWPRVQALIAKHLGREPQDIWPSRYDARGRPLPGLRSNGGPNRSAEPSLPHRQNRAAA
jgi:Ner family transcriptional regulator